MKVVRKRERNSRRKKENELLDLVQRGRGGGELVNRAIRGTLVVGSN